MKSPFKTMQEQATQAGDLKDSWQANEADIYQLQGRVENKVAEYDTSHKAQITAEREALLKQHRRTRKRSLARRAIPIVGTWTKK
jgi:hypothetical protein